MQTQQREISKNLNVNSSISYKDNFELVLMRWRYLLKSPNPKVEVFTEYSKELNSVSKKMWYSFRYAFSTAGYDYDDIRSLADVYLVGYLGMFSLKLKDKLKIYKTTFKAKNGKNPNKEEISKKDRSNFISFLTQRLGEAGKICSQKNRNIRGTDGVNEGFIGTVSVNVSDEQFLHNYSLYGYKKLKKKDLEKYLKDYDAKNKTEFQVENLKLIRVIDMGPKVLQAEDLHDFYTPDNSFSLNPQSYMEAVEEERNDIELSDRFQKMASKDKLKTLKTFISKYKDNHMYAEEIKIAKKMVKEIG